MIGTMANDLAWESADYWRGEMHTYGPDDDDGDGETDDCPTPLIVVPPWDVDGGDDDRRFAEWERAEWDAGFQAGRNGDRLTSGTQPYADGYDAGAWQLARIEAAALCDYDSWLTCAEWDALDQLTRYFGRVSFDGQTATITSMTAHNLRWWVERIGLSHLPHTECVFGGGLAVRIKGAAQWQ